MKKILILIAAALLFMIACDVLEHDAYHNGDLEDFFNDFTTSFDNIEVDNVDAVMSFYAEDYIHTVNDSTRTKELMEEFYVSIFEKNEGSVTFASSVKAYNKYNNNFEWNLNVTWESADSTITELLEFVDAYTFTEGVYKMFGNQVQQVEVDSEKTIVFAEFGTGVNCGNCPPIGAKLHLMKEELGDQFIYVEYCQDEPNAPAHPFLDFAIYYSAFTQPWVVMQGIHHNIGGTPENEELLETKYFDLVDNTPEAFLTEINWNEDTAGTISGSVNVDIGSVPTEDLKLRAMIINENPDLVYSSDESHMHNVVFAEVVIDVTASGIIQFSIEYVQDDYQQLPETASLVFALQTRPATYNNETSKVYTAAETKLYED